LVPVLSGAAVALAAAVLRPPASPAVVKGFE
jgi:hypothetical protein